MPVVERLTGREVLDGRGCPTVAAMCVLREGAVGSALVPSGASTGDAEAVALRDGDPKRYGGLGCRHAAAGISGEIHGSVAGLSFDTQAEFDAALVALDGTPDKRRLGSNALLACSVAFARACATAAGKPLYRHFAEIIGRETEALPRLTINLLSGGKHAGQQVAIQDVLIVPMRPDSVDESLAMAFDVYQAAAAIISRRYGMRALVADEGGLAPDFESSEAMLQVAVGAIEEAGYTPGSDVALAVDAAASHFFDGSSYRLDSDLLDADGMIERLVRWVDTYPILSVEDGLAQEDWDHWPRLREALENRALVVGDDLLCTNAERVRRAIATRACDTLLLKVDQAGTLTDAARAYRLARSAGWCVTISVRSGETEDDWAADLAAGWPADQFKNGSITRSERLAKLNRLLQIEQETNWKLAAWPRGCFAQAGG